MDAVMSHGEAVAYLKKTLKLRTNNVDLLNLAALKNLIQTAEGETLRQYGLVVVGLASSLKLNDRHLLKFFETSLDVVRQSVGDEFLRENGLYRSLVTSPQISPVCELFFGAWLKAAYDENPFECRIRRVGVDAFRIVSVLPDGAEIEFGQDVSLQEASEFTTCAVDDLREMPVLQ